jgi:excisionase family DNA binding protein
MLGCGNSHGYELLARGELDSYTSGTARLITVESIKRYIARRLAKPGKVRKSPRRTATTETRSATD